MRGWEMRVEGVWWGDVYKCARGGRGQTRKGGGPAQGSAKNQRQGAGQAKLGQQARTRAGGRAPAPATGAGAAIVRPHQPV